MWKSVSLRSRIFLMLSALVIITLGGALTSIWHTYVMERFFTEVVDSELPAFQASQELEISLVMQKGYVTYYFQDGDPQWLLKLDERHRTFEAWSKKARNWAGTDEERRILNEIETHYVRYCSARDNVIDLYKRGRKGEGAKLQKDVRKEFFRIIGLSEEFRRTVMERITHAHGTNRKRAGTVNGMALVALLITVTLGVVLSYTLFSQVLQPIRQLARGAGTSKDRNNTDDDVKALGLRVRNLVEDMDRTQSKLEWSRAHLQQAEKWALVGKLAAGVAHSVRNPLTSVRMRLFSLQRGLTLAPSQKEDFEVIAEEIRHIDIIVDNFLQFSRPPRVKVQVLSPSDTVDSAVQLLRHRLASYDVSVEVKREQRLPEIEADADQLKEVLVNLILNSCEAMNQGGSIRIQEETGFSESLGPVITIKLTDEGPGVPESIQGKVFQPFFSTRPEGTGLGLSISARIVEEHGGWLDLMSEPGEGATFAITLPAREE